MSSSFFSRCVQIAENSEYSSEFKKSHVGENVCKIRFLKRRLKLFSRVRQIFLSLPEENCDFEPCSWTFNDHKCQIIFFSSLSTGRNFQNCPRTLFTLGIGIAYHARFFFVPLMGKNDLEKWQNLFYPNPKSRFNVWAFEKNIIATRPVFKSYGECHFLPTFFRLKIGLKCEKYFNISTQIFFHCVTEP